ncbi:hypothetical protein XELAEV_18032113mg [Xenopus laevis]|uniref:Uncharacterized protein n=1 Tax=Xenopus laevis TaxID=8355 RepID=A0A974HGB1_XENLA|nr:hypothetical protein XELAEV_18032113mg [Xenopus laevis]
MVHNKLSPVPVTKNGHLLILKLTSRNIFIQRHCCKELFSTRDGQIFSPCFAAKMMPLMGVDDISPAANF